MAFVDFNGFYDTFPQIATNAAIKWNVNVRGFDFLKDDEAKTIHVKCLACQRGIDVQLWDSEAKGWMTNQMMSFALEKIFVRHRDCAIDGEHKDMMTRMLDIMDRKVQEQSSQPQAPPTLRPKRAIKL